MLDEENPRPSRNVFQDGEREDQGLSAPGTLIPGVVVDHAEDRNRPTSGAIDPFYRDPSSSGPPYLSSLGEDTGNTREGEGKPGASRGMCVNTTMSSVLTKSRIQTARIQHLRMPPFTSMFRGNP